jgi:putative ABC transport system permease protein
MVRNYFKTALRNLWRNKIFSLINISGLSVGLACCMLIFLFTKDEVSYDRFQKNSDHLFRIVATVTSPDGNARPEGSTGMMPGPSFKNAIPEIEDFVRVQSAGFNVKKGTEIFDEEALYVDDNFFSVFSFPLVDGDPKTALADLHSVVISEDIAKKYFGDKNAVGQTLELNAGEKFEPFMVTGVAKRSPQNSSIKIKILVPMKFRQSQNDDKTWSNFFLNTFVIVKPGTDIKNVEARFATVFNKEAAGELKEMADKYGFKDKTRYGLQPFLEMHLSKNLPSGNGLEEGSNPMYSYILSAIALLILLIACINFINLTVARSLKRAREIGVRKVVGGQRKQLIAQFLGESFILSFIAFVLAILLVQLLLPFFNALSNKVLAFSYLLDAKLVAGYVILFIVTGLMAGFYPALVLSRFNPVDTLYGRLRFARKNYLSKGLIVFQFTLATFLIIATIIIYSQFSYLMHYDLGYNDKNVVIVNTGTIHREKLDLFKSELIKNPSISLVTADQGGRWSTLAHINDGKEINFDIKCIDEDYFSLFEIPVVQGRNFSKDFRSDTGESVMVNQSFVKEAGWKNPIGQVVDFFYNNKKYSVVGVVKDYHVLSLNETIPPMLFSMNPTYHYADVFMKIKKGNMAPALSYVEKTFKTLFPLQPYQYHFKDARNEEQYVKEAKWKQIITFGAILTIFISCIGLFGLIMLSAEQRTKEIGIRKVLGASVTVIVRTISGDFLKLVLLAATIAIPVAWWTMNKWLENYPYRIGISWWMFVFAAACVLVMAFLTMSVQSLKAAIADPAKSLRTE